MVSELQRSLQTVGELVTYLKQENVKGEQAITEILFANHPLFDALKKPFKNRYRIYFSNLPELNDWLAFSKSMTRVPEPDWNDPKMMEWSRVVSMKGGQKEQQILSVSTELFRPDGTLKAMSPAQWRPEMIAFRANPLKKEEDDIPF